MASWTFLTYHARVLLCVAHDPGVRLRDIAAGLDITERSAFGIITDLVEAGYVIKEKDGRRNRYHIQAHLPAARPRQPGTHRRRSPGPPGRRRPGRDLKAARGSPARTAAGMGVQPGEPVAARPGLASRRTGAG